MEGHGDRNLGLNFDSGNHSEVLTENKGEDNFIEDFLGRFSIFDQPNSFPKQNPLSQPSVSKAEPLSLDVLDEATQQYDSNILSKNDSSELIKRLEQQILDLQNQSLAQDGQLKEYEEQLSEKMNDLLQVQMERDTLKHSLEVAKSNEVNFEIKIAEKESELKQFKDLVQQLSADTEVVQSARKQLEAETKHRSRLEKENDRISSLLTEKTAALKKMTSSTKKIVTTLLEFGSTLEKKGLLKPKQIRFLKAVEAGQLSELPDYNKEIEEKEIGDLSENRPVEKVCNFSFHNFKPITSFPGPFASPNKAESVCSEDFMDVTDEDFAAMKRQVVLKGDLVSPLSPIPPTPPPKKFLQKKVPQENRNEALAGLPPLPSEKASFSSKALPRPVKPATLFHQTSDGFEPSIEIEDSNRADFESSISAATGTLNFSEALPPELCYVSSQKIDETLFITNVGGCDFDYIVNFNNGHSAFAITPSENQVLSSDANRSSSSDRKLSPFQKVGERLQHVYSYYQSTEKHIPSRTKTPSFIAKPPFPQPAIAHKEMTKNVFGSICSTPGTNKSFQTSGADFAACDISSLHVPQRNGEVCGIYATSNPQDANFLLSPSTESNKRFQNSLMPVIEKSPGKNTTLKSKQESGNNHEVLNGLNGELSVENKSKGQPKRKERKMMNSKQESGNSHEVLNGLNRELSVENKNKSQSKKRKPKRKKRKMKSVNNAGVYEFHAGNMLKNVSVSDQKPLIDNEKTLSEPQNKTIETIHSTSVQKINKALSPNKIKDIAVSTLKKNTILPNEDILRTPKNGDVCGINATANPQDESFLLSLSTESNKQDFQNSLTPVIEKVPEKSTTLKRIQESGNNPEVLKALNGEFSVENESKAQSEEKQPERKKRKMESVNNAGVSGFHAVNISKNVSVNDQKLLIDNDNTPSKPQKETIETIHSTSVQKINKDFSPNKVKDSAISTLKKNTVLSNEDMLQTPPKVTPSFQKDVPDQNITDSPVGAKTFGDLLSPLKDHFVSENKPTPKKPCPENGTDSYKSMNGNNKLSEGEEEYKKSEEKVQLINGNLDASDPLFERQNGQSSYLSDDESISESALVIVEEQEQDSEDEPGLADPELSFQNGSEIFSSSAAPVNSTKKKKKKKKTKNNQTKNGMKIKAKTVSETPTDDSSGALTISKAFEELEKIKFDESHCKLRIHTLVNALINPSNAPDTISLVFAVCNFLKDSRRNPFLSFSINQDTAALLPQLERCLVTSLVEVDHKKKNHLSGLLLSTVQTLHLLMLAKDSISLYGLSAFCRVLTELYKCLKDVKGTYRLCGDLLKMKHKFAPYLIASVISVWPELFALPDDATDIELMYLSAILYGINKKPKSLTDVQWKHTMLIVSRFLTPPAVVDVTEAVDNLIETTKSALEEESFKEEFMIVDPLIIFSVHEDWDWTEQKIIQPFILKSLSNYAEKKQNKRAFILFCEIYSEIGLMAPKLDKPIELLRTYFDLPDVFGYVKHTAACSLLRLFLLKNQIIPAYLSQWIEENQTHLIKSSIEHLIRRRMMADSSELSEEDIIPP